MTVRRSFDKLNIGFITCGIARGCGSIRNCIVDLDIDLKYTGTNKNSDISVAGIGDNSRFADIDSCLVMGSVNIQTPGYARLAGISDEDSKTPPTPLKRPMLNAQALTEARMISSRSAAPAALAIPAVKASITESRTILK